MPISRGTWIAVAEGGNIDRNAGQDDRRAMAESLKAARIPKQHGLGMARPPSMLDILVVCALSACATSSPLPRSPEPAPAVQPGPSNAVSREFSAGPIWLRRGCDRAFAEQGKKSICGVDGITGAANPMMARTGAETKARANLARRIRTAVKAGLSLYHASLQNGVGVKTDEEQHVEEISREITEMTLVGVKVYDTYVSPDGGVWVMVFMDFDSFRQQVQGLNQYDEGIRREIVGRAEDLFRELDDATAGGKMDPSQVGSQRAGLAP
jgi:hypothetical protein